MVLWIGAGVEARVVLVAIRNVLALGSAEGVDSSFEIALHFDAPETFVKGPYSARITRCVADLVAKITWYGAKGTGAEIAYLANGVAAVVIAFTWLSQNAGDGWFGFFVVGTVAACFLEEMGVAAT